MTSGTNGAKANPLLELAITLLIPALVLMKLSGPEDLGPLNALLLALSFPLFWGLRDLLLQRKFNLMATFGLISVLLTGGIGLLQLDPKWLAVKEAAIPGIIGLIVLGSTWTRYPLIKTILYSPAIFDVARVQAQLAANGALEAFEARLLRATWMLGGTFFFSSAMNYFLATYLVVSPPGSTAFNEELGRLTLLSYPFIALPAMLMMGFVLYYLARVIREMTGLQLVDLLHAPK
jgi:hypothetical protein